MFMYGIIDDCRILPQLRFTYSLLPPVMGSLASASTTIGGIMDHDAWECVWFHRRSRRRHDGSFLFHVVFPHHCNSLRNGRNKCHVTQLKAALGGGNE